MDKEELYKKDEFISTDQLIGRALDKGIQLGTDPHQTVTSYIEKGLVPRLINGMHPANAVERVISIDSMLKEGKSLEEIQQIIKQERRSFLQKAVDLNSMVTTYKNTAFKSLLMLASLTILIVFTSVVITSTPKTFAGGVVREATKPVGKALAIMIQTAKPDDPTSTDPLGLTNISKIIKVNEKEQVVFEKTVRVETPNTEVAVNLNADTVDGAHAGTSPSDVLLLDAFGDIDITGNIITKGDLVVSGKLTGDGSGLTNLSLPNTLLYSTQNYIDPNWLSSIGWTKITGRSSLLTSIDGVSNDLGNIDFVAGAGVTITPNDTNNTITFNLAGSGVNADLLDSLDSTQFLRSDTSDSFTSGTLTTAVGTTLNVLGAFTCTNCVGDAAVVNGLTIDATGSVAAAAITGSLTDAQVSNTLSIDATGSVNAGAIGSGTLGAAGVTLALAGFGSITGILGDSNIADTITASNYLPLGGGTMAGNIDFNTNLALNLGNAGTDFTASGGLNMAGTLTFGGDTNIYRVAANILGTDDDLRVIGNDIQGSAGSSVINLSTLRLQGGNWGVTHTDSRDSITFTVSETITLAASPGNTTQIAIEGNLQNATDDVSTDIGYRSTVNSVADYIYGFQAILDSNYAAANDVFGLNVQIDANNSFWLDRATGVYINNPGGTGSLLNNYGIRIANMTKGSTTNWAIYSEGGASYHAGNLYLGRTPSGNDSSYKLVVQGSLCVDDGTPSCAGAPTAGAIYVENSVGAGNVSAFDVSEYYPATQAVEKGDLVTVAGNSAVKKSAGSYDPGLVGIVSTDPAMVIDETNITFGKTAGDNFNPLKPYVALAGRVPTKVSTENGTIEPGDPLTSSSTPGVAMKATSSGPTVGKALEAYSGSEVGKIMVFVSVGWFVQSITTGNQLLETSSTSIDTETLTAGTVSTQVLLVGNNKISVAKDGSLKIEGNVNITGELTAEKLNVSSKSSGSATIKTGESKVFIQTASITEKSQVLTTLTTKTGENLIVTKKEPGKGFTVEILSPENKDIDFDWFVVN